MPRYGTWLAAIGVVVMCAAPARAQDLPLGQIVDSVICASDVSQSYALYLPSSYTSNRVWPLLMGFHPTARGRDIVETYRAAAEQYGYIVMASNNSRNGAGDITARAIAAMTVDVARRFPIAPGRFYMTGFSGGSRVALQVALTSGTVNGVIASSAGYLDGRPRKSVPFVIFGTAGTEDFNYIEMKLLGRELQTPHRIVIFKGGHTLPPAPVAMQAIEWFEVQAMAKGTRPREAALIERLFSRGLDAAEHEPTPAAEASALEALANDFAAVRDVTALTARVAGLMKDRDIKRMLSQARSSDYAESRLMTELATLEAGIADETTRAESLMGIRNTLVRAYKQGTAPEDTPERQKARRLLRAIAFGASERVQDSVYLKLLAEFQLPGAGRGRGGE